MRKLDFVDAFYKSRHSREGIIPALDSLLGSGDGKTLVTAIPFGTEERPGHWFPKVASKSRKVASLTSAEGLDQLELAYSYSTAGERLTGKGRFFVWEHPAYSNVYVAMTVEAGSFINKALLPFLRSLFPRVVLGFIPHARLRRLLTQFETDHGFTELIISRATQRLRLPDDGTHRRLMPTVTWPGRPLDKALAWLDDNNGWFQAVQFASRRGNRTVANVTVTREGEVRTDNIFEAVHKAFVLPVCKIHHENMNLFAHRSRKDSPNLDAKPLAISFPAGQFDDVAENAKFIRAMRTLNTASVSVLHGNPYIHLAVIDYFDGSTFDVWVLDPDSIIMVPQMYGSVGAIKRLVNHVFDTYAEGEVSEYVGAAW